MPIEAAQVDWSPSTSGDESQSPSGSLDPSAVQWDQPDPKTAPFAHQPGGAGMSHPGAQSQQSLAGMLYPEVDFDTGLPFLDRTHLAQADNFAEKRAYLEKVYGKKNVEVDSDPYGQSMLVVNKDGKKIAAEGGGGFHAFTADAVGSSPTWIGMAGGALAGSAAGPVGTLAGAALGAGFGHEATQVQKQAEGTYRQGAGENLRKTGEAMVSGAEGELGGRLTSSMVSKVLRGPLPQFLTQTTSESRGLTERTLLGGAMPPAQSTLPGSKKLQFTEALARKTVSGMSDQDAANTQYVQNRMRDILRDAGVPDPHIEPTIRELEQGEAQVPTEDIGEHVKKRVQAHQEMLQANVDRQLQDLNTQIDKQLKHLDTLTQRHNPGDLGVDVGQGIRQARKDFGTAMSKVYDKVDALVGERKLVPVELIRREAARIVRRMPKSSQAPVTKELAGMGADTGGLNDAELFRSLGVEPPAGDKITFADAQRLRTMLREKADEASLTRGVTQGEMATLSNAVDYSIQSAAKDPAAAPAVRLLNAADKAYSQGIKRFNDSTVKRLVKNLEAGLPPDPEEIARQIVQPGQEARVKEIRSLVGEPVWRRVAGQDYARMVSAATDESGQVDGVRLLAEVRDRRQLMGVIYGDSNAKQIEELAKTLAARDEAIPPEALAPGQAQRTLQALRNAQETQERFLRENYLGLLGNPRRNPEQVYRWLVKPDNTPALREAVQLFGEGSPQLQGIRQAALKELLTHVKMSTADGRSAEALAQSLAKYTAEQQHLLFPNGMDSDLHLLAKEVPFLMRNLSDESKASMAAGAILSLPLAVNIWPRAALAGWQWLLSRPTTIRYLALGLRQPPGPARQAARGMLENLIRFGAIAPSLGSDEGAQQNEQGDTTLAGAGRSP